MSASLSAHRFEDLWYPEVLAWIALTHLAYLLAVNLWRRSFGWGDPVPVRQQLLFSLGLWTVYLSEGTPLHLLSETYLFSAHMVQHILLTLVMPPLILLGTPGWMLRPLVRWAPTRWVMRVLVHPVPALLVFNLIYSFWHMPVAYEAILIFHWFHAVQHAILVFTALMMWWPICSPLKELPRLSEAAQMFYIFLIGLSQIAVFGIITFAEGVMYQFYANAPRMWGIDPKTDQELAGIIMKVGGMAVFVFAWFLIFFRWVAREEKSAVPKGQADATT
ncbi:MAG: cytochrome c oxidase assembly protein [Bacillota bacterium]